MAIILAESFESTGYENTWTEFTSTGCILNPDSPHPGTPPQGAGKQCLRARSSTTSPFSSYIRRALTSTSKNYVRAYVYITELDTNTVPIIRLIQSGTTTCSIQSSFSSPNYRLRYAYYSGGALQNTAWVTVSLNTWYLVEFQYDTELMQWEWRLNGATQHSGTLTSSIIIPNQIDVGLANTVSPSQIPEVYYDLIAWDNANWIGAEEPTQNNPLVQYQTALLVDINFQSGVKRFAIDDIVITE